MKKLTTVFAVLVATTAFAASGCNKKKEEAKEGTEPAGKMADDKAAPAGDKMAAPAGDKMAAPAPAGDKAAAPAAAAGDLPAECADYKASIEKLATCDKL